LEDDAGPRPVDTSDDANIREDEVASSKLNADSDPPAGECIKDRKLTLLGPSSIQH
jgi:hypothetical protein